MSEQPPRDLSVPDEDLDLVVREDEDGLRLDRFLAGRMPWRSRTNLRKLLDGGRVDAGPRAVRPGTKLREGDRVHVDLPPPDVPVRSSEIPLEILHEDEDLLALNKQPGVVVHPVGRHRYDTLINALHHRYRNLDDPTKDIVPKLAHRIDQYTSGVLLIAKRDDIRTELGRQFEEREVRKRYLAIVKGVPPAPAGVLDFPLGQDPASTNKTKQGVREDGAPSRTTFEVIERFASHALVACEPHTGRTHQIRVHLAAGGWPIVCDHLYGDPEPLRHPTTGEVVLERYALHAAMLTFHHPGRNEAMTLEAPLPADMTAAVEALRVAGEAT